MEAKRYAWVVLMVLIFVVGALILTSRPAMAQTQGEVAVSLAALLGFDSTSADRAIAALTTAGIVPAGGWNATAPATPAFIGALYTAVNSAVAAGTVTPPAAVNNASSLVAAATTAAGVTSTVAVNAVAAAGGNSGQAATGASFGVAVAAAPAPAAGGVPGGYVGGGAAPGGGAGGGGGGAVSPSR
jgi:hypothetical protein